MRHTHVPHTKVVCTNLVSGTKQEHDLCGHAGKLSVACRCLERSSRKRSLALLVTEDLRMCQSGDALRIGSSERLRCLSSQAAVVALHSCPASCVCHCEGVQADHCALLLPVTRNSAHRTDESYRCRGRGVSTSLWYECYRVNLG